MHRKHTRLAARAHRVATAVERRGIRATYAAHDRLLSNRASRGRYRADRPTLDAVQQRIVDGLDASGFAALPFGELHDDPTVWKELAQAAERFVSDSSAGLQREATGEASELRRRQGKEFVVRGYSYGVEVGDDDPWFRLGCSRRMLDIANAYLRLWSKFEYFDLWYSVPQTAGAERVSSQRWHRDFNDQHLVKAFLYLVDVDERMGPFQYVAGSAATGPYAREWPWTPLGANYPDEGELERRIAPDAVQTFTGPAGTLLFCNTSGFHRGGQSRSDPRVLATWTYSSPASLKSLTERSYTFTGARDSLDVVQRFAVD